MTQAHHSPSAKDLPFDTELAARIDAALPQTQCKQCEYPDCRGYAEALAAGKAEINQCPPGGDAGIVRLAALTGRVVIPLNPRHGIEKPFAVAVIDEAVCIGCTLCIQACPVDAIVGAAKLMHTVLADECTGCELCIAPCPVDCIDMLPATLPGALPSGEARADLWRRRHQFHLFRVKREKGERADRLAAKAVAKLNDPHFQSADKQAKIRAALDRAAQRAAPEADTAAVSNPAVDTAARRRAKIEEAMAKAAALRATPRAGEDDGLK
ncbi:MAG: electron transport complex subunit RsxB [Burkholderiales bacterium]|nr:electron transport complex subunit RsxB [Burkholderiales bacterium]